MTIPNPDPYYKVEVTAGSYSWTLVRNPAVPQVPTYGLADPLKVSWSLPNSDLVFLQPDPFTGSFALILEDMADIAGLTIGDAVHVVVYPFATLLVPDAIVAVHGRVSNIDAKPHQLGMLVTVSWVDYTVDLAEAIVGTTDWPAETYDLRVARVRDELGLPLGAFAGGLLDPATLVAMGLPVTTGLAARPASPIKARDYLAGLFDSIAFTQPAGVPGADPTVGNRTLFYTDLPFHPASAVAPTVDKFKTTTVANRWFDQAGDRPALLQLLAGGKVGIVIDPTPSNDRARVIDACHVEFSARYTLSKDGRVDTYVVSGPFTDGTTQRTTREPDAVPVVGAIDTELTDPRGAENLGRVNLVGHDSDSWVADTFTFWADLDPRRLLDPVPLLQNSADTIALAPQAIAVVNGVQAHQSPTGDTWYAGSITGVDFTLAGGRYSVQITMRRYLPKPAPVLPVTAGMFLTWDDCQASFPAKSWTDLEDQHSWFDARLLRSDF